MATNNTTYIILPFHWGSRDVYISDWIALFTLGLAPLVAHILSGAPRPSYLHHDRPQWHDVICHYNPASILWRYAAITDRRIRSRNWGPVDIAASNAIFWTPKGWNGSENMLERALPYATRLPEGPMVRLLSLEMLKTVIVFLQGIQAVTSILGNFTSTGDYTTMDAVSGLFIPIGACGLLRLCAALWLTDDFHFAISDESPKSTQPPSLKSYGTGLSTGSVDSLSCEPYHKLLPPMPEDFHIWYSRAFRMFFMMPIAGCFALDILFISPLVGTFGRKGIFTTTSWLLGAYYLTLLAPTVFILGYYFGTGPLRTTIIPCISKLWYKVYCIFVAVFTIVLIAVAAIEMRKTFCGKYTSLTPDFEHPCATGSQRIFTVGQDNDDTFAIAQGLKGDGRFTVANFTGTCLGVPDLVDEWRNAALVS
ncbi:hypothetical protein BKA67DRAFT_49621 [Truncatella angustata]|uniref:Uncharacterized protein n=1 Tax=Truncatella angustata TaxID=152316 RepID=A0A9P8UW46_9PEZI|nr:uncharacterized protein BKA67DRAFT_49621 [Truncatella angustata]KAH6660369.1 hypothetical protein BKA67DRAFT_49621 [Truncatella angustata]